MKTLTRLFAAFFVFAALLQAGSAAAQEAPDALIKRISQDVLDSAKTDRAVQAGNQKRIQQLVEAKILPYVDFQKMTALTAGRHWREATPSQKQQLTTEFRELLVHTYSGAIAQIKDQTLQFRPLRANPAATDVIVYSQVLQSRGREPIQLNYRLAKRSGQWKVYDINVLGAWLVQTYKGTFETEIRKGGIDGLIRTLAEKNRTLATGPAKGIRK
ncbi:MAG: ABC transporter substrate-binding protein [Burkholderiaceae bacterium]|nr:ABC transporter substrate-binding protein [Burkholderiaceae bacterium]